MLEAKFTNFDRSYLSVFNMIFQSSRKRNPQEPKTFQKSPLEEIYSIYGAKVFRLHFGEGGSLVGALDNLMANNYLVVSEGHFILTKEGLKQMRNLVSLARSAGESHFTDIAHVSPDKSFGKLERELYRYSQASKTELV